MLWRQISGGKRSPLIGKQVELLKYHASFHGHGFKILYILRQLDVINADRTSLVHFKSVQGADKCCFSRTRETEKYDHLLLLNIN